jgi:hypothetical protein
MSTDTYLLTVVMCVTKEVSVTSQHTCLCDSLLMRSPRVLMVIKVTA